MTQHLHLLGLGDLEDIWDDSWSSWSYAPSKTELPLISDGSTPSGNVVIQESAKGYREGQLTLIVGSAADRDTVRGYDEDSATVTFTDYDGSACSVLVMDYSAAAISADLWRVTVRLVQLSEPVAPGS